MQWLIKGVVNFWRTCVMEHYMQKLYTRQSDCAYDYISDLLDKEAYSVVNEMLQHAEISKLSMDQMLNLLTVTLRCKTKLPFRAQFYADCRYICYGTMDPQDVTASFAGLE